MHFEKLSSLARFKASCPFLGRTKTSTLRTLCTSASVRYPTLSQLTERATKCPVMGPALSVRSKQIAQTAGYASVAGNAEMQRMHTTHEGIFSAQGAPSTAAAGMDKCPHASAARRAAELAQAMADAKQAKAAPVAATCPFAHQAEAKKSTTATDKFDYESFYATELEKKHKDKSYRYFNNINRLANKFPVAHTGATEEEVTVWCANDYLGMGKNPVVLETIQYVSSRLSLYTYITYLTFNILIVVRSTSMAMAPAGLAILQEMVPCTLLSKRSLQNSTASLLLSYSPLATSRTTPRCLHSGPNSPVAFSSQTA